MVNTGITLTIEPGVTVLFRPAVDDQSSGNWGDKSELRINSGGTLMAVGFAAAPIRFLSANGVGMPEEWGGIIFYDSQGSTLSHCQIEHAYYGISTESAANPVIENCQISHNNYGIYVNNQSVPTIRNNTIFSNSNIGVYVNNSPVSITNNTISANRIGINVYAYDVVNRPTIIGNVMADNTEYGLNMESHGASLISGNTFSDNNYGIYYYNWSSLGADYPLIQQNSIIGSTYYGIYLSGDQSLAVIHNNNIHDSGSYNIYNGSAGQIDARYNYWGTESADEMNAGGNPKNVTSIYDSYDNSNKGFVNYAGWLSGPLTTFSVTPVAAGSLAVNFDASGFVAIYGEGATFSWEFGDGSVGSTSQATHTYQAAGRYTVSLTVLDTAGNTIALQSSVSVPVLSLNKTSVTILAGEAVDFVLLGGVTPEWTTNSLSGALSATSVNGATFTSGSGGQTVIVTVRDTTSGNTASATVQVHDPLTFSSPSSVISKGSSLPLTIVGGSGSYVCTSSNTALATVDETCMITAAMSGSGSFTITATDAVTYDGVTTINSVTSAPITLLDPISVTTGSSPYLSDTNRTFTINATGGGSGSYTYVSSNTDVVTVDSAGVVTAVAHGTANITIADAMNSANFMELPITVEGSFSPAILFASPANQSVGVAVDQPMSLRFSVSMNNSQCDISLNNSMTEMNVPVTVSWGTTALQNDTVTITPSQTLHYSTSYELSVDGGCQSVSGVRVNGGYWNDIEIQFATQGRPGDNSAPKVISSSPFNGQIGWGWDEIIVLFDKPIDPATVTAATVQLTGSGNPVRVVSFPWERNVMIIKSLSQLTPNTDYTVTLTTGLKDAEGHAMTANHQFSFNTGPADTTPPTIRTVLPQAGNIPPGDYALKVYFSENMDPATINESSVTLYDRTELRYFNIHIRNQWVGEDGRRSGFSVKPAVSEGGQWVEGHTYELQLNGSMIADMAGNVLDINTTVVYTAVNWQLSPPDLWDDDTIAIRMPDGKVTLEVMVNASSQSNWENTPNLISVLATDQTQSEKSWNLTLPNPNDFSWSYNTASGGDEGLNSGYHNLLIQATDSGNSKSVALNWDFYVFNTTPVLTAPTSGATQISTTPTFSFTTTGLEGADIYRLSIMESTTEAPIYSVYIVNDGRSTPYDFVLSSAFALATNTTYKWRVDALDNHNWHMGEAHSLTGSFTTTATELPVITLTSGTIPVLTNTSRTFVLSATGGASGQFTFASSNSAVATVDGAGVVTAVGAGSSTITLTDSSNSSIFLQVPVTVEGTFTSAENLSSPMVLLATPADQTVGVAVDGPITLQFDAAMDSTQCSISLQNNQTETDLQVDVSWGTTLLQNDTVHITPMQALRYSTSYELRVNGGCQGMNGVRINGGYWEELSIRFATQGDPDDSSAPKVVTTYPYNGEVGWFWDQFIIVFDKPIDPATVTAATVQLSGAGTPTRSVDFPWEMNVMTIRPTSRLTPNSDYTLTLTTGIKDAEGHALAVDHVVTFNTGPADTVAPVIRSVVPQSGKVAPGDNAIKIYFSENMDPATINESSVTVFDETDSRFIAIHLSKKWVGEDGRRANMQIRPASSEGYHWQQGHYYIVTLNGAMIADLSGNTLGTDFTTTYSSVNWSLAPPDLWDDDTKAIRMADGTVKLETAVNANSQSNWENTANVISVLAIDQTQSGKSWSLTLPAQYTPGNYQWSYETPTGVDEGLTTGYHDLLLQVTDSSNGEMVSLNWNFYVFNTTPVLSSPAMDATGVSVVPTLEFTTTGLQGAELFRVMVANSTTQEPVFFTYMVNDGRSSYSVAVPQAYALEPSTTYQWRVVALDNHNWDMGEAHSVTRSFTTGANVVPSVPPVAVNGSFSGTEDGVVTGTLLASDQNGDALTFAIISNPSKGSVVITNTATGAFTYTPNANQNGQDQFTFKSSDSQGDSNTATVTITLASVQDPPVASNGSFKTLEDTVYQGTLVAQDPDGETLTYTVVTQPTKGTLTLTAATGQFTYTPLLNVNGTDSFTFTASDGSGSSNTATFSITITPVNDAPVAQNGAVSAFEGIPVTISLVATDVENDTLTYPVLLKPQHGTLSGVSPNLLYLPDPNWSGTDTFTFRANDGRANSATATVTITVKSLAASLGVDLDALWSGQAVPSLSSVNCSTYDLSLTQQGTVLAGVAKNRVQNVFLVTGSQVDGGIQGSIKDLTGTVQGQFTGGVAGQFAVGTWTTSLSTCGGSFLLTRVGATDISAVSGWGTPPLANSGWVASAEVSGQYRSKKISHSQRAQIHFVGEFDAGNVRFEVNTSSEVGYDRLRFYIDGVLQGSWSGETSWTQATFPVAAGAHILVWSYEKDASTSMGEDLARIRQVRLPIKASAALTNLGYDVPSGAAGWTENTQLGAGVFQASRIEHNRTAQLRSEGFFEAGTISFAHKVSSEKDYDFLLFSIDGKIKGRWSGEDAWATNSYTVAAGPHSFVWSYEKDKAFSVGEDTAWIKEISLPAKKDTLSELGYVVPNTATSGWSEDFALGAGSFRANAITDNQKAQVQYTGYFVAGTVGFTVKLSSEANLDSLIFSIDGVVQSQWSGEVDWTAVTFPVTTGVHTFLFSYEKNGSVASGSDTAWIKALSLPIEMASRLLERNFDVPTTANAGWLTTPGNVARVYNSAKITHSQKAQTRFQGTFTAGQVTFGVKTSSESGFDQLSFSIDGVVQQSWSGEMDWRAVSFKVTPGIHTLLWSYEKDDGVSSGSDRAWIRTIELPLDLGTPPANVNLQTPPTAAAGWSAAPTLGAGVFRSGAIQHGQAAQATQTATLSVGEIRFSVKVSSEFGYDTLSFYLDGQLKGSWSGEQDWKSVIFPVSAGSHTMLWSYQKDESDSKGDDAAWIGQIQLPVEQAPVADTTPPETSVSLEAGSYNSVQTVTLNCDDGEKGSGCKAIYYTLDGTTPTTASTVYSAPFALGSSATLRFMAVDTIGNVETTEHAVAYEIDTEPPQITITSPADGEELTTLTSLTGQATDSVSEVESVSLRIRSKGHYLTALGSNLFQWVTVPSFLRPTKDSTLGWGSWSLDVSSMSWETGILYSVEVEAVDAMGNSVIRSSVFSFKDPVVELQLGTRVTIDTLARSTIETNDKIDVQGRVTLLGTMSQMSLTGREVLLMVTHPDTTTTTISGLTRADGGFSFQDVNVFLGGGQHTLTVLFPAAGQLLTSSDTKTLWVGDTAGYVVLVQGRIPEDPQGLLSHNKTTNRIYATLIDRGFSKDNIQYFNYNTTQAGVHGEPDKTAIQSAIETWAAAKMAAKPGPLYLIMVNHGNREIFHLGSQAITPTDVNLWLATLETALAGGAAANEKRIVILGSCFAGSFINDLYPAGVRTGRVVIASAAADEESYKGPTESDSIRVGEYFLEEYFNELGWGFSLREAFVTATQRTELYTRSTSSHTLIANSYFDNALQHPLLEDDGMGQTSLDAAAGSNVLNTGVGDGEVARLLFLGIGPTSLTNPLPKPPEFTAVTAIEYLAADVTQKTLWATLDRSENIGRVWVGIRSPETTLTKDDQDSSVQLEINLTQAGEMVYSSANGRWELDYNGFTTGGRYEIYYFAQDSETNRLSGTVTSVVYKSFEDEDLPAEFSLLSPLNNAGDKATVLVFDWEDTGTTDDDITYNLLIATDRDFQKMAHRQNGLTSSSAFVDEKVALSDDTTYYWKVEAVNKSGGLTASQIWSFHTNNTNGVPGILTGIIASNLDFSLLAGAVIKVGLQTVKTEIDGSFIAAIPSGATTISVQQSGFIASSASQVTVKSGDPVHLNVQLDPLSTTLNVDSDTHFDALSDGLLISRYLFGLRGDSLLQGVVNSSGSRTTATAVEAFIASRLSTLDIDGNGTTDGQTDGMLILRYLFGFRGTALTQGLTIAGTRTDAASITTYLNTLQSAQ